MAGLAWIGAGIAAYGAIYFGFHDVIVHRRVATRYLPKSSYMKRIVQAHRLHHAVETKRGTVSFGFLWAPRPDALKAELNRRDRAGVRSPAPHARRLNESALFFALAIPAVILLGLSKGGFVGMGALSLPILALAVSPVRAAAILLPVLIVQDVVGVWAFRR